LNASRSHSHGKANQKNITITRTEDTLTLEVGDDGPTIFIKNGPRKEQTEGKETYEISCCVDGKNKLTGWQIAKSGVTSGDDVTVLVQGKKPPTTKKKAEPKSKANGTSSTSPAHGERRAS
jgi:hypothetical protein